MGSMNLILAGGDVVKSFGLTRSGVSDTFSVLLNHLIGPCQHIGWDRQADLLGGF
jgi:hypothetical protein